MSNESSQYVLALDQGTTGSTALLFDSTLEVRGSATVNFPQHFPEPGWVEHDLNEIWSSVIEAVRLCLEKAKVAGSQIAAIGITNQRETTCLWHRDSGAPLTKAIVWQDRRTAAECARLKKQGLEKTIQKKTGLLLDPYFSGTKLAWLLSKNSEAKKGAKDGSILFGTIESYLLYRLSGGQHFTDPTNACRTLLMNLKTLEWDEELLKVFKIPRSILPEIKGGGGEYGKTKGFPNLPDGIPITGLAGDQQAALFGQACFKPGSAKCTYGTGAFILVNTGSTPIFSKHRLLSSVAWQWKGKTTYCLEGSAFIAGAAVQWVRDGLGLFKTSAEIEGLARTVPDSDGVYFVPALSGLGAPHWWPDARGIITGLTRRSTKAHVARATLDGIAFQVRELLEAMTKDLGKKIQPIKVDGGASANNLLMQFQADLMGVKVIRSKIMETTALGAGLQAGLAIGYWKDFAEVEKLWKSSQEFEPQMKPAQRNSYVQKWDKAVAAVNAAI